LAEREYGVFSVCVELYDHILDLISPEKLITLPVLETVPNIQELSNAVVSYVVCIVLCLIPV
jgi:hypothetical protein